MNITHTGKSKNLALVRAMFLANWRKTLLIIININIGELRDEFINLKDIVIKRLHDENQILQEKYKKL